MCLIIDNYSDSYYYRLNALGDEKTSWQINRTYRGAPSNIESVVSILDKTYIFKVCSKYIQYSYLYIYNILYVYIYISIINT